MRPDNHAKLRHQALEDPALGLGAKGLLCLVSQLLEADPDTAVMAEVQERTKDSDYRIAQRMKELVEAGYITRRRGNAPNGKLRWVYDLHSPKRASKRNVA